MADKIVVGVAGMPGAGKSLVISVAREKGSAVVVMGDEIREETRRRGLEPTPENIGKIMLKLREEKGSFVVAERCISKIKNVKEKIVIIDGIRSLEEVETFRKHFSKFALIAVHASPETRFKRLFRRKRSDDTEGWETFVKRDLRELSVGLGSVIATAEHMIINDGSITQTKMETRKVLRSLLEKWMK